MKNNKNANGSDIYKKNFLPVAGQGVLKLKIPKDMMVKYKSKDNISKKYLNILFKIKFLSNRFKYFPIKNTR